MLWQPSPYTIPLVFVSMVSLVAAFSSWRRQKTLSGIALSLLMLSLAVWATGYALQLAGADAHTKEFWRDIKNIGVVPVPTLWLIAVLQYTGYRRWLSKRIVALLAIEPIIGLLISWTNDWHHFFEKSAILVPSGSILLRVVTYGWWFWFNAIYSYVLFIISAILLIHTFLRARRLYRQQILILLGFVAVPWIGNGIYVSKLILNWGDAPIPDITPFLFISGGLLMIWGTLRYQLMDVVPIARDIIVNNMRNGVLVLDTRGVIVDLNPVVETILGYTESEIVGTPVFPRLSQWQDLTRCLKRGVEAVGEQALTLDGKPQYFEWRVSPLTEPRAQTIGWVVVFQNITQQKITEEALRTTNQQLQKEIETRERLIKELDAFAHTVAHDLKNPLSVIVGYVDVLRLELAEASGDIKHLEYAEKVEQTAKKMGHIVDELLLLANVRQENVQMYIIDTARIIVEVEHRLAALLANTRADIIKPKRWHNALGYAPWVEEVWENLISNAIKYGGTPARIEIGSTPEAGEMVRFWVKDNGDGLPLEVCKNIFDEAFARKIRSRRGSGIGLSIVRRIIERHGGTVRAENSDEPGTGCVFSFTLPAPEAVGTVAQSVGVAVQ